MLTKTQDAQTNSLLRAFYDFTNVRWFIQKVKNVYCIYSYVVSAMLGNKIYIGLLSLLFIFFYFILDALFVIVLRMKCVMTYNYHIKGYGHE